MKYLLNLFNVIGRSIKRRKLVNEIRGWEMKMHQLQSMGFPIAFEGKPSMQDELDELYRKLDAL